MVVVVDDVVAGCVVAVDVVVLDVVVVVGCVVAVDVVVLDVVVVVGSVVVDTVVVVGSVDVDVSVDAVGSSDGGGVDAWTTTGTNASAAVKIAPNAQRRRVVDVFGDNRVPSEETWTSGTTDRRDRWRYRSGHH